MLKNITKGAIIVATLEGNKSIAPNETIAKDLVLNAERLLQINFVEFIDTAKEEAERLAKEKEEQERLAKEEAERLAKEKEEAERLAKEKEEQERLAKEEAEKKAANKPKAPSKSK